MEQRVGAGGARRRRRATAAAAARWYVEGTQAMAFLSQQQPLAPVPERKHLHQKEAKADFEEIVLNLKLLHTCVFEAPDGQVRSSDPITAADAEHIADASLYRPAQRMNLSALFDDTGATDAETTLDFDADRAEDGLLRRDDNHHGSNRRHTPQRGPTVHPFPGASFLNGSYVHPRRASSSPQSTAQHQQSAFRERELEPGNSTPRQRLLALCAAHYDPMASLAHTLSLVAAMASFLAESPAAATIQSTRAWNKEAMSIQGLALAMTRLIPQDLCVVTLSSASARVARAIITSDTTPSQRFAATRGTNAEEEQGKDEVKEDQPHMARRSGHSTDPQQRHFLMQFLWSLLYKRPAVRHSISFQPLVSVLLFTIQDVSLASSAIGTAGALMSVCIDLEPSLIGWIKSRAHVRKFYRSLVSFLSNDHMLLVIASLALVARLLFDDPELGPRLFNGANIRNSIELGFSVLTTVEAPDPVVTSCTVDLFELLLRFQRAREEMAATPSLIPNIELLIDQLHTCPLSPELPNYVHILRIFLAKLPHIIHHFVGLIVKEPKYLQPLVGALHPSHEHASPGSPFNVAADAAALLANTVHFIHNKGAALESTNAQYLSILSSCLITTLDAVILLDTHVFMTLHGLNLLENLAALAACDGLRISLGERTIKRMCDIVTTVLDEHESQLDLPFARLATKTLPRRGADDTMSSMFFRSYMPDEGQPPHQSTPQQQSPHSRTSLLQDQAVRQNLSTCQRAMVAATRLLLALYVDEDAEDVDLLNSSNQTNALIESFLANKGVCMLISANLQSADSELIRDTFSILTSPVYISLCGLARISGWLSKKNFKQRQLIASSFAQSHGTIVPEHSHHRQHQQQPAKKTRSEFMHSQRSGETVLGRRAYHDSSSSPRSNGGYVDAELSSMLKRVKQNIQSQESHTSELASVYEMRLQEAASKELRLSSLLEAKSTALAEADALLVEYRAQQSKSDQECKELRERITSLEKQLEGSVVAIQGHEASKEELEHACKQLYAENEDLTAKLAEECAARSQECARLSREKTDLEEREQRLMAKCRSAEHQIASRDKDVLQYKHALAQADAQTDAARAEIEDHQQRLHALQEEYHALTATCSDYELALATVEAELTHKSKEFEALQYTLNQKDSDIAALESANSACEAAKAQLEQQIVTLHEELEKHKKIAQMIHSLSGGTTS